MKERKNLRILWLGSVFDKATLLSAPAVSPAANRWQVGLIQALQQLGNTVHVVGYLPEPAWPRGRLRIKADNGQLPSDLHGQLVDYWNVLIWRNFSVASGYRRLIHQTMETISGFNVVITYNAYPANVAGATYARKRYDIPWVCVVADGEAPRDADGYVFLSWGYYQAFSTSKPKLHLDGGVSELRFSPGISEDDKSTSHRVVMYTGTLSQYGGADFLARAFQRIDRSGIELWICGKGSNAEIEGLAAVDTRIKIMGFVPEHRLEQLACRANVFVNPRPSRVPDNEKNFPSKIFVYLSYGKPVISTWGLGLSPEFRHVLVILEEETEECLASTIKAVLDWGPSQRQYAFDRTVRFLEGRLWCVQAGRLVDWLVHENFLRPSKIVT